MSHSGNTRSGGNPRHNANRENRNVNRDAQGAQKTKINVENASVKEVIAAIHEMIETKERRGKKTAKDDYVMENRVFSVICWDAEMGPSKCAETVNERYGMDLSGDDVIRIFRGRRVAKPAERKELLLWARKAADLFAQAVSGNKASYEEYEKLRRESALGGKRSHDSQGRILAVTIYERYPEIDSFGDKETLHLFGDTLARYFLFDMSDAVRTVYEYPQYKEEKEGKKKNADKKAYTYEEAIKRIEMLESQIERTNALLQDLQDEFDEQLEDSKTKELVEFFSKLNSDKYGSIIDELLSVRKGIDEIKKEGYSLPYQIGGLIIMVKQLMMFIRDSHIEPMMRTNTVVEVCASDVESCIYDGTPFRTPDEKKRVRVLSPGWVYKDKEIQISRPKVKEEI